MRRYMFTCFLFTMFGSIFYVAFFHKEEENPVIDLIQDTNFITFWSNDYHIR